MVQYVAGTTKGATKKDDVFNDPFELGKVDPNYTSDKVVETVPASATELTLAWTPVVEDVFTDDKGDAKDVKIISADGKTITYADVVDGKKVTGLKEGDRVAYEYNNVIIPQASVPTLRAEMKNKTLFAHARRIAVKIYAA